MLPGMLSPPHGHVRQRSVGKVERNDSTADADEPLLDHKIGSGSTPPRSYRGKIATLWVLSLICTSWLTYSASRAKHGSGFGSLESGFTTELGMFVKAHVSSGPTDAELEDGARSAIKVGEEQFHGSLDFKDRHGFIPADSPSLKYVGDTAEVDGAWHELVKDRYFLLSDEEARASYDEPIDQYWNVHHGGYVAGLDVLHTLHCLNQLRMSLYPKTYPQDPVHSTMHLAHCIDHLRQLAMCNADLTPVPTQWFPGLGQNYINSSQLHTCRDFWQVREWATERFNGSTAFKARNRDGSQREEFYAPWSP